MEEQWTLEKLGGHKYRLHRLWDGTPEMLDWLKKEGYRALSEGNMDYYYDFEEQDEPFNFGVSMSECFQELVSVRRFQNDFSNTLARNNWDVDFGKRLADNGDPIEILLRVINTYGVEFALYQLAANYSKPLAEKAQRMRQELDESGFITWLKENIKPRVPLNTEDILRYNVVPREFFEDINWQDVFYSSWTLVRENMSRFANWVEANELAMKNPAEVFNEFLLDHSNENKKMYALFYWFGYSPCACHLFTMLNSQEVTIGVKNLIRKVLTDYGSNDEEFAAQLQHLYDKYKDINDGVAITFQTNSNKETAESESAPVQKPTPQIEGPEQEQPKQVPKAMDETSETRQNLFNASVELIEVIVDFIEENYDKKFIVDYFERILINPKYKSDSNKLVDDLAYNRSQYEYNGLKVMGFCHIIGFLITKKVIKDNPINLARKIYPELDKYPEKSDSQNYDEVEKKRINSLRLYIQDAKDSFAGKSRKTIAGCKCIMKVFDDMPMKTKKKPKTA